MSRLSLRLPESLHHQLASQARHEGVSLNQYLPELTPELLLRAQRLLGR